MDTVLNTSHCLPADRRGMAGRVLGTFLALVLLPAGISAQSRDDLKTLFFDPVYPAGTDTILLSSGDRPGIDGREAPPGGASQQRPPGEILEDIRRYETNITKLIEDNGIYDPVLAQEYLAAGDLYEQLGDRENAVQAFENAMHISRVNQGLFTLAQEEAVRALIDSNKAVRDYAEADKYHEYLYYLLSQNLEPDSEELINASLEWADWNLEAYRRMIFQDEDGLTVSSNMGSIGSSMLRRGELVAIEDDQLSEILFVPRSALLTSPATARMQAYTAEQLVDPRLRQTGDLYETLLENNAGNLELLRRQANITFLFKTQLEQHISINSLGGFGTNISMNRNRALRSVSVLRRGYADSREDLLELAESLEADNPLKAAEIYLDIGDWDLVFDRQSRAEGSYNLARELLLTQGMDETDITAFVSPEPALLIPSFVSYEYTREFLNLPETMDIPYIGYIDVSFEKRPDGTLRRVSIENASDNTGQPVRDRLLDMLRSALMRPLFVGGETIAQSDIKVRYYYSY